MWGNLGQYRVGQCGIQGRSVWDKGWVIVG